MRCVSGSMVVSRALAIYATLSVSNTRSAVNNDEPCPRSSQHLLQSHWVRPGVRYQLLLPHSRSPSPEFCLQGSHQAIEGLVPLLHVNKRTMRWRGIPLQTILYYRCCRIQLPYPYQHLGREMLYKYRNPSHSDTYTPDGSNRRLACRIFFRKTSNFGRPLKIEEVRIRRTTNKATNVT